MLKLSTQKPSQYNSCNRNRPKFYKLVDTTLNVEILKPP